jgi:hypothetical protein
MGGLTQSRPLTRPSSSTGVGLFRPALRPTEILDLNGATTIIERRSGTFEPTSFRDRYRGAWRASRGDDKRTGDNPRAIAEPPKVINLMEALKRSLVQDAEPEPTNPRAKTVPHRRLRAQLLRQTSVRPMRAPLS